jgi:hypothetical protein
VKEMRKEIVIKENGKIVKRVSITLRDRKHLEAQIKNPHIIAENKKKYNRKKLNKKVDIE